MLLAADIGNTNITFGLFGGDHLLKTFRLETKPSSTAEAHGRALLHALEKQEIPVEELEGVALASVVPSAADALSRGLELYMGQRPFVVGADTVPGLRIKTDVPEKVGPDRLVNAAAACHIYGGPALVIDFGTATTYDVVTAEGDFLGGVIAPGIKICAQALWEKTASLPVVPIAKPERVLGANTVSSMQSGVFYGYVGQVEYLTARLKQELGFPLKTIATGGLSSLFRGCTDAIDVYDEHLTLNGLQYLYHVNHALCV